MEKISPISTANVIIEQPGGRITNDTLNLFIKVSLINVNIWGFIGET